MANLYEIDRAILECLDMETGEIIDPDKLSELQLERGAKIESVALWITNLNADVMAYKTEKESFAEKEKVAKNKIESLKKWLTEATAGNPFKTTKVSISYRKSEAVEFDDEEAFMEYALNNMDNLLKFSNPTPDKTAIKTALKDGFEFDGVSLVERQNIQIK